MAQKWNEKVPWNRDNYVLRVMDEVLENSKKSGAPMVKYSLEVAAPENMEVAGEPIEIVGKKMWHYIVLQSKNEDGSINEEKTEKMLANHRANFYGKLGMTLDDPSNPPMGLKGKLIHVGMYNNQEVRKKTPTKAELDAGKTEGEPMTNPVSGEPLMRNTPVIEEWFGLAKEDASKPY